MAGVFIGLAKYLVIWFKTFCGIQINGSFVPKAEVEQDSLLVVLLVTDLAD